MRGRSRKAEAFALAYAGDGTITSSVAREAAVRARTRGEVDADLHADALEALDRVLDEVAGAARKHGFDAVEDDLLAVGKAIESMVDALVERANNAEETLETEREELKQVRAEAEEQCKTVGATADEWRRRAERAEHELEEKVAAAVKAGQEADAEGRATRLAQGRRIADQARSLEILAKAVLGAVPAPDEAVLLARSVLGIPEERPPAKKRRGGPKRIV